ncbi:MAG: YesL family protein [Bacillota bacterium]
MLQTYGNKIYQCCEWILRLSYLNLIWILFTLVGFVIMGIFPATVSAFAIARRWVQGDTDVPLFRTFAHTYKTEFWKSQILGFLSLFIGGALALYIYILNSQAAIIFVILKSLAFLLFFIFIWTMIFVFPMFVHYKLSFYQFIKNTLFVTILNPIVTILSILGLVLFAVIVGKFPGLIPVFGISAPVLWITFHTQRAFKRIEEKKVSAETVIAGK